ncbi:MAG: protease modulator HflC [Alphaproteobacteria bacterium]|nr:protease modulator HflC [Alphaproteobacteria bacterium]
MNRLWIIAGVVAVGLYVLFSSLFIVNAREQAIVTRFGEITRVHLDPGIYFKIPTEFVESVQIIENRLLRYDLEDITVQVRGGKFYNVDAFVTYEITDPKLFRQSVQANLLTAETRIKTQLESALRQVYGLREFDAALSEQRTEMMVEAGNLMRANVANLGIEVIDVRVLRTDLTDQVSAQTYDRMKAERLAEAALLRARGQEQAQTLKAIADRQAVQIVAEAQREAEILRGEGEAQRSAIFADAYGRDPEFFDFYRSMQAYREALDSDSTTLLLSPDSDFFRFFGSDSTPAPASAPATAGQ